MGVLWLCFHAPGSFGNRSKTCISTHWEDLGGYRERAARLSGANLSSAWRSLVPRKSLGGPGDSMEVPEDALGRWVSTGSLGSPSGSSQDVPLSARGSWGSPQEAPAAREAPRTREGGGAGSSRGTSGTKKRPSSRPKRHRHPYSPSARTNDDLTRKPVTLTSHPESKSPILY